MLTGHHHVWAEKDRDEVCVGCGVAISRDDMSAAAEELGIDVWWREDADKLRVRERAVRNKLRRLGL